MTGLAQTVAKKIGNGFGYDIFHIFIGFREKRGTELRYIIAEAVVAVEGLQRDFQ